MTFGKGRNYIRFGGVKSSQINRDKYNQILLMGILIVYFGYRKHVNGGGKHRNAAILFSREIKQFIGFQSLVSVPSLLLKSFMKALARHFVDACFKSTENTSKTVNKFFGVYGAVDCFYFNFVRYLFLSVR